MAKIVLVSGGARSGKSSFAEQFAEGIGHERLYLATCPVDQGKDPEMAARIDRHRHQRKNRGWRTVEEPLAIDEMLNKYKEVGVILIDCLTLWVSNLMMSRSKQNPLTEVEIEEICRDLLQCVTNHQGTIVMVTNEVGSGIVPDNALARLYRDLVGRCNQIIGAAADEVVLVSCGVPLRIKG